MVKGYCLNCKDRYTGCHAVCSKYAEYKRELERIKENRDKERLLRKKRCVH